MAVYQLANYGVKRTTDGLDITPDMLEWADYRAWQKSGGIPDPMPAPPPSPPPTKPEIEALLSAAVQGWLDDTARSHGYDGILSAASYAISTNKKFSAEGKACVKWRDAVWAYCWRAMADVEAGKRSIPTASDLLAELPAMVWPQPFNGIKG